jgi:single-strand DNA-binding protein
MASVNKAIILGNAGRDPEVRYAQSGMAVCNLSIATSSKRKDKASGEYIEETQWHRVTFYDKLAEIVGQYVKKGMRLYVEGRIVYRKYTDKDGVEKTSTEIVASEMQMLSSGDHSDRPSMGAAPTAPTKAPAAARAPTGGGSGFDDMSDDIPF